MWGDIAIAFLLAFITSFVGTPYTIKLAKKLGTIDMPNDRRVNKVPIPRLGGIAVITGFIVSAIYLVITMSVEGQFDLNDPENYKMKLLGFFLGIIIIMVAGLLDDIKDLKPWIKLLAQIGAAAVIYVFGIRIDAINEVPLHPAVSFILTMGWIIGITNAVNLIDGLDGLSSGTSLISCVALLLIFATNGSPIIAVILITCLAGAIVGFLPFNIHPAKTFIGDAGSQFLGFALSIIAMLGVAKTVTLVVLIAPILVLGLPIFDTIFAIIRRIVKGKSIKAVFKADRGHIHHRLMRMGYTQSQAVAILYAISATLGLFAVILIDNGIVKAASFMIAIVVVFMIGSSELAKYKEELVKENIKLGLVDPKDMIDPDENEKSTKKETKNGKRKSN